MMLIKAKEPDADRKRATSARVPPRVRYTDKLISEVYHEAEEFDLDLVTIKMSSLK
jgi:hypothetical protein